MELVELDKIYPDKMSKEGRPSDGVALKEADEFVPSQGLTEAEAAVLLAQWGRNELPEKVVPKVRGGLLGPSLAPPSPPPPHLEYHFAYDLRNLLRSR